MNERRLHQVFEVGVLLKGLNALVECAAGLALFLVSTQTIIALVYRAAHNGLIAGPHSLVANHLVAMAQHFSVATKSFYAAYLLGHGTIKIGLVAGLLCGWRSSYPLAIFALAGFVVYQLYRLSHTHGLLLAALTAFDVFLIAIIWHEWGVARHVREEKRLSSRGGSPAARVRETQETDA